jgi:hypothetical protein
MPTRRMHARILIFPANRGFLRPTGTCERVAVSASARFIARASRARSRALARTHHAGSSSTASSAGTARLTPIVPSALAAWARSGQASSCSACSSSGRARRPPTAPSARAAEHRLEPGHALRQAQVGEDQHGASTRGPRASLELPLQASGQPGAATLAVEHLDRRPGSRVVLQDEGEIDLLVAVANAAEHAPDARRVHARERLAVVAPAARRLALAAVAERLAADHERGEERQQRGGTCEQEGECLEQIHA